MTAASPVYSCWSLFRSGTYHLYPRGGGRSRRIACSATPDRRRRNGLMVAIRILQCPLPGEKGNGYRWYIEEVSFPFSVHVCNSRDGTPHVRVAFSGRSLGPFVNATRNSLERPRLRMSQSASDLTVTSRRSGCIRELPLKSRSSLRGLLASAAIPGYVGASCARSS